MSRGDIEAVFAAEAAERLAVLESGLEHPEHLGAAELTELRREAHTLNGTASVLGLSQIAAHAETAERILERALEGGALDPSAAARLRSAIASLRAELGPKLAGEGR